MPARNLVTLLSMPHLRARMQLIGDAKTLVRLLFLSGAQRAGILAALDTAPASADALVARLGFQRPELLDALLRLGVYLKELSVADGRYRVSGARSKAIVADDGDALAAMIEEMTTYYGSVFEHLPATLNGGPLGDYLAPTASLIARSSRILEPFVKEFVNRVVKPRGPMRMLEIGCGSGIYVRHAAERNAQLAGIAVDLREDVVQAAAASLDDWGIAGRFRVIAADVRIPPAELEGPFDLITLYNNIYYFDPGEWPALFARCRGWLKTGGALAIVSMMRGQTLGALEFDIACRCTAGLAPLPRLNNLTASLRVNGFHSIEATKLVPGESVYGVIAR